MISSTIDPRLAAQQADTKDLIRFKQEMDGLKGRLSHGAGDKEKQLKKACQNFEAVFIGKLWQQMKSSVPKEGYLHSKQEDSYMSMFDRDFSERMAEAGGIGLADMIYAQLSEKLKETSKTALSGGVDIKPLVPQPIAMGGLGAGIPLRKEQGMTLEDWGGTKVLDSSGGNRIDPAAATDAAAVKAMGETSAAPILNDVEVQAKLDALARRLESERIRDGLLGSDKSGGKYEAQAQNGQNENVGRKLAKIG